MADEPGHVRQRDPGAGRDLSYPPLPVPLVVPVYDNHTHLEIADGEQALSVAEQLDRASSVGVRGVIQVGGDLETSRWSAEMAAREPRMLAAVAIHPNEAPVYEAAGILDDAIAEIAELATRPRVVAVGETGLDFFRTGPEGHASQLRSFEAHIEIAKRNGLALQIHDRDAHEAVIETLLRVGAPERTVFHCFSGDVDMARVCADHGWYLSFAGTVTFKNAGNLREALAAVPRALLLVETDAPFLTPAPFRGRPNAPYLLPNTLRAMADHLETDVTMLAAQISSNTELVYGRWDAEPVTAPDSLPNTRTRPTGGLA
ncbi:TatD family deoxyribonuclease [Cryobacterium sp. TMT1-21]|uniref:TatD family deoxyribonuclease n=1 Tax=Cryobacterium shii TaxID=1259235 RepID=A0AAQ2HEN7_9MICO|nr:MULTISPECIES: TatD family hydrolase [Cryobacterium]TFC42569.1 TatD family deoxyribonuclease [Cryobacterium shii]TFC80901.1 TatD family deoxyribonuclease [Cryobacterium sp. TmT2-59]TFD15571.1 TatD family deoxyribonuclease [Cryobacterium sp. TMT1-21]TFD18593.1 TatD family deoxyribonuclease [Cryobacterium sp. TMT4-10]TFD36683.1 TatD family deoxyribonuclease [Cryobacterium sp. TMT2-10]